MYESALRDLCRTIGGVPSFSLGDNVPMIETRGGKGKGGEVEDTKGESFKPLMHLSVRPM